MDSIPKFKPIPIDKQRLTQCVTTECLLIKRYSQSIQSQIKHFKPPQNVRNSHQTTRNVMFHIYRPHQIDNDFDFDAINIEWKLECIEQIIRGTRIIYVIIVYQLPCNNIFMPVIFFICFAWQFPCNQNECA